MSKLVEEWRPVVGFEGLYEVSDWGNVKSLPRVVECLHLGKYPTKRHLKGNIMKQYLDDDGYCRVNLNIDGYGKPYGVHRLVAEAFIPNPENKPCVDHINSNRADNKVENLRWYSVLLNNSTKHARQSKSKSARLRQDNKKQIVQITLDGKIVKIWECGHRIKEELGFDNSSIIRVCKGQQDTSYGFKWKYYD